MRWMAMGLVGVVLLVGCQGDGATTRGGDSRVGTRAVKGGAAELADQGKFRAALAAAEAEWAAAKADPKASKEKKIDAALLLGDVQSRLALYKDAGQTYAQAAELPDAAREEDQLLLARVENALGEFYYAQAEFQAGLEHAKKGLELRAKRLPADDVDLADSLGNVGFMLADSSEPGEDKATAAKARKDLLKSWQIRIKKCGAESVEAGEAWNNLGLFFLNHDAGDEGLFGGLEGTALAERCLKKGLEIRRKSLAAGHPDVAESLLNLAYLSLLEEKVDDADKYAKEGMDIVEKAYGRDHPDVAYALNVLGQIREKQERMIEAEAMYMRAQGIYEKVFGANHYYVGTALEHLMGLYEESGQKDKAAVVKKKLDRIKGRDI